MYINSIEYRQLYKLTNYNKEIDSIICYDLSDKVLYIVIQYQSGLLKLIEYNWDYIIKISKPNKYGLINWKKSLSRVISNEN